jgi:hypothetical protein
MKKTEAKELSQDQILDDKKLLNEHEAPTEKEIEAQANIVKKRIKKINRNHKLYVRDLKGGLRRLDKISLDIYGRIIILFLKGDGEKRYSLLNTDVKSWDQLKPLQMPLDKVDAIEFMKLQKALGTKSKSIVVSYNGSWKPLVNLYMFVPKDKLVEVKE